MQAHRELCAARRLDKRGGHTCVADLCVAAPWSTYAAALDEAARQLLVSVRAVLRSRTVDGRVHAAADDRATSLRSDAHWQRLQRLLNCPFDVHQHAACYDNAHALYATVIAVERVRSRSLRWFGQLPRELRASVL